MPIDYRIPKDIKALILSYKTTAAVKNRLNAQQKQWFESIGTTPYIVRWYINHNLTSMDAIHCCNCGAPIIYHKNNQYSLENIDLNHCYCSVACSAKDPVKQQRMKQTNLKRYGCEHVTQNKQIYQKKIQTSIDRYGEDYGKVVRLKGSKTNLEKYGATTPFHSNQYKQDVKQKYRSHFYDSFVNLLTEKRIRLMTTKQEYISGINIFHYQCIDCGKEWWSSNHDVYHMRVCDCHVGSIGEQQILEYIQSIYNGNIVRHDRSTLDGFELDFILSDIKVAVEFNGLFWHSTNYRSDYLYHQTKSIDCMKKGICLYQIYEDQWLYNQNDVKQKLYNLINKTIEYQSMVDLDYNVIPLFVDIVIDKIIPPKVWYAYQNKRFDPEIVDFDQKYYTIYDSGKCILKECN